MRLRFFIQILVSLLLLYFVFRGIDPAVFTKVLHEISALDFIILSILLALTQAISAFRWFLIACAGGIGVKYSRVLAAFFLGMYANLFGLGTLGGDVVRGTLVTSGTGEKTQAVVSAFADRALGLFVLLCIGILSLALSHPRFASFGVFALLFGLALVLFLAWKLAPFILKKLSDLNIPFAHKMEQIAPLFSINPASMITILTVATIYHISQITLIWALALQLGASCSYTSALARVPFINIVSTLPVSWNGLGIRENAFIFFFSPELMTSEHAVMVSMIWLAAMTTVGACGGIFSYLSRVISQLKKDIK